MTDLQIDLEHYAALNLPTTILPLYLFDMMEREGMQTDITEELLTEACNIREKELFCRSNETREHNRQYKDFLKMRESMMDAKEMLIVINLAKRLLIQRAIDDQKNRCKS
jgi:hypothetical protein